MPAESHTGFGKRAPEGRHPWSFIGSTGHKPHAGSAAERRCERSTARQHGPWLCCIHRLGPAAAPQSLSTGYFEALARW